MKDKKQVQENVKRFCNLDSIPKPDDAADALAVAIATSRVGSYNVEKWVSFMYNILMSKGYINCF